MLMFLRGIREGFRDRGWCHACECPAAFRSGAYWRGAALGAWLARKVA